MLNLPDRQRSPERFAYYVLKAIGHGSKITSPLLHTTRNIHIARRWRNLGRDRRLDENYLVRIRCNTLPEECIVDMSTLSRQDVVLAAGVSNCWWVGPATMKVGMGVSIPP